MASFRRRGLLIVPPRSAAWFSHAQNPTVLALAADRWRIYFAARNEANRATVFAADVDPRNEMRVLEIYARPLLPPGAIGAFDVAGLGPSCALAACGRVWLYYVGVTVRSDVPYQHSIGLAVSDDGLAFERVATGPVLSTGPYDPIFVSTPFVRHTGSAYEMWYGSATGWDASAGRLEAAYAIRRTVSADGVVWSAATTLAVPPDDPRMVGATRPWIARDGERSRVWFSRRGADFRSGGPGAYRLVHAPLADGGTHADGPIERVVFENPPQPGDWDAQMQAYPCVMPLGDDLVMFYNGNEFGRAGLGWATTLRT
ncbi:MAG: hypothetical protein QOJ39_3778 [Candidatus Eremiobacteraeota bacterium]|nr:hypothetical protein [Candidatus Eremiobacteraeota bacterium]